MSDMKENDRKQHDLIIKAVDDLKAEMNDEDFEKAASRLVSRIKSYY